MLDVQTAAELKAWATHRGDSVSIVARELIELGLASMKASGLWGPPPPTKTRRAAWDYVERYADRQRERRRANNAEQRAAASVPPD